MHYVTMEDLLGANTFHNINTYAISDIYNANSDEVQYDLRNRNAVVKEGDRFRYDYNLLVNTGKVWGSYTEDFGNLHYTVAGRLGYTNMQRDGKMQNGLAANNSYGKSKHAEFVDGGLKFGSTLNMGHGNTLISALAMSTAHHRHATRSWLLRSTTTSCVTSRTSACSAQSWATSMRTHGCTSTSTPTTAVWTT